jgi:hypothetical protein
MLEHVALGSAVAIAAATVPGYYPRPDIAFRPLDGIPTTPLLLATRDQPATTVVRDFQALAVTVAAETARAGDTARPPRPP